MQIWHLLIFIISVFKPYKIQECNTEHLQIKFEMECKFYTFYFLLQV